MELLTLGRKLALDHAKSGFPAIHTFRWFVDGAPGLLLLYPAEGESCGDVPEMGERDVDFGKMGLKIVLEIVEIPRVGFALRSNSFHVVRFDALCQNGRTGIAEEYFEFVHRVPPQLDVLFIPHVAYLLESPGFQYG